MEGKTLTARANAPVIEQLRNLDPNDFASWSEGMLESAAKVTNAVNALVSEGRISTIQGGGILACTVGQLFDYQGFHHPEAMALQLTGLGETAKNGYDRK